MQLGCVVIDYYSAERTLQYLSDFEDKSDLKDFVFCIVDNSCDESNFNHLVDGVKKIHSHNSVSSKRYKENEIIIIDSITTVLIVKNFVNEGFAKGNNIGFEILYKMYNIEYVLFTNNDIQFQASLEISRLVSDFRNYPDAGVIGTSVIGTNGKPQTPCREMSIYERWIWKQILWPIQNYNKCLNHLLNKSEIVHAENIKKVYRVLGAFMLCRSEAFIQAGMFDSKTFLYAEELILSERMLSIGYNTYYEPNIQVVHEGGYTTKSYETSRYLSSLKKRFKSEMYYYKEYKNVNTIIIVITKIIFQLYLTKYSIVERIKLLRSNCLK
jgi:GT2 family glycosyltransferase